MGLKASIGKIVESAIVTVGDLAETITYNARTTGSYNVTTGAVAHTTTTYSLKAVLSPLGGKVDSNDVTTTTYSLKAVLSPLGGKVDANDVSTQFTGDLSMIFASRDLAVTPDTNDTITRDSAIYAINSILSDPALASYTLILTRVG